ncbi:hypothetical protein HYPBUDRAFT_7713 [Hyphopichia burtonii NRRL Y-1933]|uniref:Calcium channel YVC1-like C-terminal transmembrane domain-containing protein n=1 Tax=Hyphopichia burtonii NRRL Y-1933 TaxID=984485 RepID=A0A1E4RE34_9ASCO|nr:hypothetical protein HYPBUDRAFT_7713 [Hyphopichia burtonii NRRL Y-1933]ODV65538.1 hypothetical protein HYPBUDRAFT_7713 [Hyphopichia burtonii NRRL Y-1933]
MFRARTYSTSKEGNRISEFKSLYFQIKKHLDKVNISLRYEQLKTPEIYSTLVKSIVEKLLPVNNIYMIYVLLLVRYEYMIQSENDLMKYDLLMTKANLSEILAIRMLREYRSVDRTNMLFINTPVKGTPLNVIELTILSKLKKFLSQPIIVHILDKFYKGNLVIKQYKNENEENGLLIDNVVDHQYERVSIGKMISRSNKVPKYQSIIINMKYIGLTVLYLIFMNGQNKYAEIMFWILGLSFNIEMAIKFYHIEYIFLKKILWTYVDMVILLMIDVCFILKVSDIQYQDYFSILSIILFPRILSIFNNYEFFHMIILSFKKMLWNMIGMFILFLSLIFGFFICFISLTINKSNYEIAFDMLKVFFGFTPAIWTNWDNYTDMGKVVQMSYLFLIQFIINTILAIVLGNIFVKINQSNKEEFEYFKTINLIIYLKWSQLNENFLLKLLKFPIVIQIFVYELLNSLFSKRKEQVKTFQFFDKEDYEEVRSRRFSNATFKKKLLPVQSISTLGIRSASTDSTFIDEILNKKYPTKLHKVTSNNLESAKNDELMKKLDDLQDTMNNLVNDRFDHDLVYLNNSDQDSDYEI